MEKERRTDTYKIVTEGISDGASVVGIVAERLKPRKTIEFLKREAVGMVRKRFMRYGRKVRHG